MIKERDYLWDNIKALLICLVVTGHCIEVSAVHHSLTRAVNYWIYSFHMPAFIFVSGFWAKSYCKNGRVRAEKLATLICYYTAFQILFSVLKLIFNIKTSSISFFSPARGLWYLLAMIFFYLLVPLAERLPSYIVLPALITLGVLIGKDLRYDEKTGTVLTDRTQLSKDDKSSMIRTSDDETARRLIKNTYKTLLTRGQKGCFIYCEDHALADYIRSMITEEP